MNIAIERKFYEVSFSVICSLILGSIQFGMCLSKLTMSVPTVGSNGLMGLSRVSQRKVTEDIAQ